MKEKWKPCPGYKAFYEVSNLGNFRTVGKKDRLSHKISGWINASGYTQVHFRCERLGINEYIRAHRLVALAFIPNPMKKPHINHKDGNKSNNKISNLEWVTPKENRAHAVNVLHIKTKLFKQGGLHLQAKLSAKDVRWIYKFKDKLSKTAMAKQLGVDRSTVSAIAHGWRWAHMYVKYFRRKPRVRGQKE